ncbi:MAG: dihydroorotate dehydrogenase [Candidatus Micrarchaeota archaeon]
MADLSITLCGIKMKNPLILASGIRSNNASLLIRAAKEGAGAVTSKSCSLNAREGHPNPTAIELKNYIINAIGLSNPGVDVEVEEIKRAVKEAGVPVISSIYGASAEEFVQVAKKIASASPAMIELDASCPNIQKEGKMFSSSAENASEIVKTVKKEVKNIPISIKLSANVPNIGEISRACEEGGADCISAINTLPAMLIDIYAKKPVLANKYGGLSGPAIFPIALHAVNEIRNSTSLPIIGGGGIISGKDAVQMLMAGANAISIGSALYYREKTFEKIKHELIEFMEKEKYEKIEDIKME